MPKYTDDKDALEKAAQWSRKAIDTETDNTRRASAMDMHANILHKPGRTKEALEWQEKAVAASQLT